MTDFLAVRDVLYLHTNQIDLYGGDHGVRDMDLLDSAIAQPQATFGGKHLHAFPFEMAAAYMFHIVQNHPFVDAPGYPGAPGRPSAKISNSATSKHALSPGLLSFALCFSAKYRVHEFAWS